MTMHGLVGTVLDDDGSFWKLCLDLVRRGLLSQKRWLLCDFRSSFDVPSPVGIVGMLSIHIFCQIATELLFKFV